jgi:hypothetical protein
MSQEILFLIFLALEAIMLVGIYQLVLLKMIRQAVVRHWIEEIESGRIDLPQVLDSYTQNLLAHFDALLFGYKPEDGSDFVRGRLQKFYEGAAGGAAKTLGKEGGVAAGILNELSNEPWYVQAIAQKLMPALENLDVAPTDPQIPSYNPGITRK